ncbi:MAG: hypothetical protein DRP63_04515 [Planctomycetota bacterium]|nr:MAG: hypothetical protein DRP63_04515 [Planctomycetota bacterium]
MVVGVDEEGYRSVLGVWCGVAQNVGEVVHRCWLWVRFVCDYASLQAERKLHNILDLTGEEQAHDCV